MSPAALQLARGAPGTPQLYTVESDPAVRIAFTGRHPAPGAGTGNLSLLVGDGDVAQARAAALRLVGATPANAVFMQQVHGARVAVVTTDSAGQGVIDHHTAVPGVDAMVTTEEDLALAVLVADCVPIVLVAPRRAVAVVHAGRRGVAAGVVANAVSRLGARTAGDVVAVVGPAVGGCCYEVPRGMADDLAEVVPPARSTTTWGATSLDLPAAVDHQLRAAGVNDVQRLDACTRCGCTDLFSHRATTAGIVPAGRQAGIVMRAGSGSRTGVPARPGDPASVESPASP